MRFTFECDEEESNDDDDDSEFLVWEACIQAEATAITGSGPLFSCLGVRVYFGWG